MPTSSTLSALPSSLSNHAISSCIAFFLYSSSVGSLTSSTGATATVSFTLLIISAFSASFSTVDAFICAVSVSVSTPLSFSFIIFNLTCSGVFFFTCGVLAGSVTVPPIFACSVCIARSSLRTACIARYPPGVLFGSLLTIFSSTVLYFHLKVSLSFTPYVTVTPLSPTLLATALTASDTDKPSFTFSSILACNSLLACCSPASHRSSFVL